MHRYLEPCKDFYRALFEVEIPSGLPYVQSVGYLLFCDTKGMKSWEYLALHGWLCPTSAILDSGTMKLVDRELVAFLNHCINASFFQL